MYLYCKHRHTHAKPTGMIKLKEEKQNCSHRNCVGRAAPVKPLLHPTCFELTLETQAMTINLTS